ncbi:MAG: FAD:protein FMN transferase [Parachlamydiaceae bacterium]
MTIDYHVIVGKRMNGEERGRVEQIIDTTFKKIDQIYNKWNPASEISLLNRLKAGETVKLSKELEQFFYLTDSIVGLSQGKFDPTVEPLQQLWKSALEKGEIPPDCDVQRLLPAIGWKNIHFNDGMFFKDHDETRLDLGGIAKGYCVDLLVEGLIEAGFYDVFVEWGGEVRANGQHPDDRPWRVISSYLENSNPEDVLVEINLENESVATSGDYIQNWTVNIEGEEMTLYHIIDPVTAQPLRVKKRAVSSGTVIAPTCVIADAFATIAMMYPTLEEANEWAKEMKERYPAIKFHLFARDKTL